MTFWEALYCVTGGVVALFVYTDMPAAEIALHEVVVVATLLVVEGGRRLFERLGRE